MIMALNWCWGKNVQNCRCLTHRPMRLADKTRSSHLSCARTMLCYVRFSLVSNETGHDAIFDECFPCESLTKPHNHLTKCCIEKETAKRARGITKSTVDWHLPWSSEQQTTYRCQYDWFGCLFGWFFLCISFTIGRSRQSQRNGNDTMYIASLTTCLLKKTHTNNKIQRPNPRRKTKQFHLLSWTFQTEFTFIAAVFTVTTHSISWHFVAAWFFFGLCVRFLFCILFYFSFVLCCAALCVIHCFCEPLTLICV